MNAFPGLQATILRTLEEEGEVRPPAGALAQQWFWQAASQLQARGKCVADQRAGVVRRVKKESLQELSLTVADQQRTGLVPVTDTPTPGDRRWEYDIDPRGDGTLTKHGPGGIEARYEGPLLDRRPAPATDLPARLRLLLRRWRAQEEARGGAEGAVYGQCANDLQEVMEECGVPV